MIASHIANDAIGALASIEASGMGIGMKVDKRQFDEALRRLLKAEPETAATIAKPIPKKVPDPKPSR